MGSAEEMGHGVVEGAPTEIRFRHGDLRAQVREGFSQGLDQVDSVFDRHRQGCGVHPEFDPADGDDAMGEVDDDRFGLGRGTIHQFSSDINGAGDVRGAGLPGRPPRQGIL